MADLAETLLSIPLFSGLSREDIAKILGKLEDISFPAGAIVFSQGDAGDAFYLVQSGTVQVMIGNTGGHREIVAALGPGEWFGEMALLSGEPRAATVNALVDTVLWRLGRHAWDDLLEKHPSWLVQFCAMLSKRLAQLDQQYSHSRGAFDTLAAGYYESRAPEDQNFLRRASLVATIDPLVADGLLQAGGGEACLNDLKKNQPALIQSVKNDGVELHPFFREFLRKKLLAAEGKETELALHARIAAQYEAAGNWQQAMHHSLEAQDWSRASKLIISRSASLQQDDARFIKAAVNRLPREYLFSDVPLVHLKVRILAQLGDTSEAIKTYKEAVAQKAASGVAVEAMNHYQAMADDLLRENKISQALRCLRGALNLAAIETASSSEEFHHLKRAKPRSPRLAFPRKRSSSWADVAVYFTRLFRDFFTSQWFGAVLGLAVWAYLWFWTPDIGLEPAATKQLALLSLTLIYWVFWVFPDYGVALIFALGLILTGLADANVVLSGFASTSWFMTLGVLGLGAAITSSGLFYRLSLQLVRIFPLNYYWQIIALGFMGIVVMALIPQQSARTAIISQMLLNLSESLGYKNPSQASTGLFTASFLGLGHLGFLFLTGSTTSLIAWGLLPPEVQSRFTWGYWFIAALPPTLVVIVCVLVGISLLFKPESRPQVSYKMVENQLGVLGPLSKHEWITLIVLCLTILGWLTAGYHKLDSAWISLAALCVLVNTGVLGWGMMKKGIDWEMLLCMGVTLAIPTLLAQAKIDKWLVGFLAPLVLPLTDYPALCFVVIALIGYVMKLALTSFLTVITLTVALLPLSEQMGINPWVIVMIVLIASEVWFFPFQVDWHTLAYSTTDGKGFTYRLMYRINPIYAVAYLLALIVAIPYWRYLGLMR